MPHKEGGVTYPGTTLNSAEVVLLNWPSGLKSPGLIQHPTPQADCWNFPITGFLVSHFYHKVLPESFDEKQSLVGEQLILGLKCTSLEAYFCYYCPAFGKTVQLVEAKRLSYMNRFFELEPQTTDVIKYIVRKPCKDEGYFDM